ncbi:unnamed protein product [Clonostachys rhizophaga]|uniref:Uncharacterized protein n=1 Tax=Clonostachys rhizophaga TaxID=160324 RepID=A0A9N9UZJ6_9HYPO|nr:unnamed protein product [Clonostachys rhizophaga]
MADPATRECYAGSDYNVALTSLAAAHHLAFFTLPTSHIIVALSSIGTYRELGLPLKAIAE